MRNWSHVVSLLFAQLAHSIGLNDVCDDLQLHRGAPATVRGAVPPSRNGLSHANKVRPAEMAGKLFWAVFDHLGGLSPEAHPRQGTRSRAQVQSPIHIVDTSVIELVANAMDWAKHRRRKAAAKTAPEATRLVVAPVEWTATEREIVFLTNNVLWSSNTVADLYRCRWEIEGKSPISSATKPTAVRWQVWMALLTYVLLRY